MINTNNTNEVVKIRKVDFSMNENKRYETIKKLVDTNGNKKRAAVDVDLRFVSSYYFHAKLSY